MSEQTKSNKKITTIVVLVVVAIIAAVAVWFLNYNQKEQVETVDQSSQQEQLTASATILNEGKIVQYQGVEGQTALALLKQYADVKTEEFAGVGEYVVSINGVAADSNNTFWGFYVNGEQAQVGAGDYTTMANDSIEWRLEDVSAFQE